MKVQRGVRFRSLPDAVMPERCRRFSPSLVPKTALDGLLPELENRGHVSPHFQLMGNLSEPTKRQLIMHFVQNSSSINLTDEPVLVMPSLIGPFQLHIHKLVRRLPFHNLRRPVDGKYSPPQPITDQASFPYRFRGHAQNSEVQPRRRQLLQVFSTRKELEHLFQRAPHKLLCSVHISPVCHLQPPALQVSSLKSVFMHSCARIASNGC